MLASFFKYLFFGFIVDNTVIIRNIFSLQILVTSSPLSSLKILTGTPIGPITKVNESNNTAVDAETSILAPNSPLALCATAILSPALAAVRRSVAVNEPFSDKRDAIMSASEIDSGTNSTIQSMQISGRPCSIRAAITPRLFDMMDRIILTHIMQCLAWSFSPDPRPSVMNADVQAKTMLLKMMMSLAARYSEAILSATGL
mmetsp:Transcript_2674/g.5989  ORF Transcript_2674/g.5989 Transcript_2674/m.5989 type:complete len:201 (-) Transcript_2674:1319-1921(-)